MRLQVNSLASDGAIGGLRECATTYLGATRQVVWSRPFIGHLLGPADVWLLRLRVNLQSWSRVEA